MIPITELPGTNPFFGSSGFGSCTIFIGTAYIEGIVTAEPAKTGKDIS
jgi:hypothetical protein